MNKLIFVVVGFIVVGVLVTGIQNAYSRGRIEQSHGQLEELLEEQSFNNLAGKQLALEQVLRTMEQNRSWIKPLTTHAQSPLCGKLTQAYTTANQTKNNNLTDVLSKLASELRC